ncbi:hypothetical protein FB451DRAFT_1180544 [Mycena latifolia]|nr:hypothetical protein FB451DRAFT_1180544 [Mycena latifolia]
MTLVDSPGIAGEFDACDERDELIRQTHLGPVNFSSPIRLHLSTEDAPAHISRSSRDYAHTIDRRTNPVSGWGQDEDRESRFASRVGMIRTEEERCRLRGWNIKSSKEERRTKQEKRIRVEAQGWTPHWMPMLWMSARYRSKTTHSSRRPTVAPEQQNDPRAESSSHMPGRKMSKSAQRVHEAAAGITSKMQGIWSADP